MVKNRRIPSGNVKYHHKKDKYEAFVPSSWNYLKKRKTLGTFHTREEAQYAIDLFRQKYVKIFEVLNCDDFDPPGKIISRKEEVQQQILQHGCYICIDCSQGFTMRRKCNTYIRCDPCFQIFQKNYRKTYKDLNDDQIQKRKESRKRFLENPSNKIAENIGSALYSTLKIESRNKSQRGIKYTGLKDGKEFMDYMETLFTEGMTRENYGLWHVDHIIPKSSYDHTKETEIYKCWNFRNLQPKWASDNSSKGAKITDEINKVPKELWPEGLDNLFGQ